MKSSKPQLKVMHIISGDLWAGAEIQAYTLLGQLRTQCKLSVVLLNPGRLADDLRSLRVPVTIIDETQVNSLSILLRLRCIMKEFRPDVVHTHRQKENVLGSFANMLSVRAKCIRTIHGAPEFEPKGWHRFQAVLDRFSGQYLQDSVISVSSELKGKLERIFASKKIHVVKNGVDIECLKEAVGEADFRKLQPDHMHIGFIGRLEPVKRGDIFLKMIPILMEIVPEKKFHFHVVGEGTMRCKLECQAGDMGIKDVVTFHGHRNDTPTCIKSLDAMVICSDHEGTPMTALEALAIGTPLIAHNVGGLREIFLDSPEYLVDDHSSIGYAKSLKKVLFESTDPVVLNSEYFSSFNAARTLDIYNSVIV